MTYLVLCILFLTFIGYREFFIYKERQQLLDRIQATNFIEFKRYDDPHKKVEKEEKKVKPNWL